MWRLSKDTARRYVSLLLFAVLFALGGVCLACQPQTVQGQTEQLSELKAVLIEQQMELSLLQAELMMLEMPSNELIESLREAKSQLAKSETDLLDAKTELEDAKLSMNELSESLTILKESIAQERAESEKKLSKIKRERNVLVLALAGCLVWKG